MFVLYCSSKASRQNWLNLVRKTSEQSTRTEPPRWRWTYLKSTSRNFTLTPAPLRALFEGIEWKWHEIAGHEKASNVCRVWASLTSCTFVSCDFMFCRLVHQIHVLHFHVRHFQRIPLFAALISRLFLQKRMLQYYFGRNAFLMPWFHYYFARNWFFDPWFAIVLAEIPLRLRVHCKCGRKGDILSRSPWEMSIISTKKFEFKQQ